MNHDNARRAVKLAVSAMMVLSLSLPATVWADSGLGGREGSTDPGLNLSTALAYYNDSSGGTDEHTGETILGDTGAFSDYSNTVYQTMRNNNKTDDPDGGAYYFTW